MIKQILDEITQEPGTKNKMKILEQHKDNQLLKDVLYQGMSKRVKFYTKTIPEYNEIGSEMFTLEHALTKIALISNREYTGSDAQNLLKLLLIRYQLTTPMC